MKHLLNLVASIGLLLCFSGIAMAQSDYRAEIFGGIGVAKYEQFFGASGSAANFEVGVGFRPFSPDRGGWRGLGFQFRTDTQSEKIFQSSFTGGAPVVVGHQNRTLFLADVLYHFTNRRAQPYISLGIGASRATRDATAAAVASGVKVFLNRRVSLRPELRVSLDERVDGTVRGSVAIGYHW
jgi:hypothetical protein